MIFVAFYRRAEISANRASPAHVIRPSDGGHKNAPNRASYNDIVLRQMCFSSFKNVDDVMAKKGYRTIPTEDDEEKFSFASLLLFRWMNVVFKTGGERALEQHDFLPLSQANSTCLLTEQLQTNWRQERTNCKTNGKKPSLWKSVVKMVSVKDIFILVFTTFLFTVSRLLQPLLLGYLVSTLMTVESQQRYPLYVCSMAMCLNAFLGSLAVHQFDYRCEVLAIRISSALKGLVYLKVSISNN